MTLLISILCSDGFVIISDRKEQEGVSYNEMRKCHLSNNDDYFIALSGNGGLPRGILSIVDSSQITSDIVEENITRYVTGFNNNVNPDSRSDHVKGFLVLRNNDAFIIKILDVLGQTTTTILDSSPRTFIGSELGKVFAKCFLDNTPLEKMTCENASKHVVAVMDKISKYDRSVGGLDYGIDITMFSNTGEIIQRDRLTDTDVSSIDIKFDINSKNIFEQISSTEDQHNGN